MDMTQSATQSGARVETSPIYVRNLCALWESDPRLAMALEAVPDDDVPPLAPAREGGWTVRIASPPESATSEKSKIESGGGQKSKSQGGGVYLHSRYRPLAEGRAWAHALPCDNRYAVVVCGFGLGYHVKALWERLGGTDGDAVIVVAEPNLVKRNRGRNRAALRRSARADKKDRQPLDRTRRQGGCQGQ